MSAIKYWLWLSTAAHLSPRSRAALLEHYGGPEEIYLAPLGEYERLLGRVNGVDELERRDLDSALKTLERCASDGIDVISFQDAVYPDRLKNVFSPPAVLYCKGRLPDIDSEAAIAIIGTRDATPYGIKMARRLGTEISECGGLVVSGLTRGIDAAGAEGALMAGKPCIGVLGTSHDKAKGKLFDEIAARGALISEYPPGTATYKDFFLAKNRITAGLSIGVCVVEAPAKSGTRLFVDEAMSQGKEIFAVPGNADAHNCEGTNLMLKNGAVPVTEGWEILREFEALYPAKLKHRESVKIPETPEKQKSENKPDEKPKREKTTKKVVDKDSKPEYIDLATQLGELSETQLRIIAAIDRPSVHIDDIITRSGLSTARVLADLTMLQLKGFVGQESGKRFTLKMK